MSLGNCEKCRGDLCVSGRQVTCERCGNVHPDHPAAQAWREADARPVPPAPVIPAQDFAVSWIQRITDLERRVAALEGDPRAAAETAPYLRKKPARPLPAVVPKE